MLTANRVFPMRCIRTLLFDEFIVAVVLSLRTLQFLPVRPLLMLSGSCEHASCPGSSAGASPMKGAAHIFRIILRLVTMFWKRELLGLMPRECGSHSCKDASQTKRIGCGVFLAQLLDRLLSVRESY